MAMQYEEEATGAEGLDRSCCVLDEEVQAGGRGKLVKQETIGHVRGDGKHAGDAGVGVRQVGRGREPGLRGREQVGGPTGEAGQLFCVGPQFGLLWALIWVKNWVQMGLEFRLKIAWALGPTKQLKRK